MRDPRQAQESDALDIAGAARIARRRAPLILLCALVVAAAAFAFSKQQTKEYTATSSLVFSNNPLSQQIAGLEAASGTSQIVQQASNIELVKLGDMAAKTAAKYGLSEEEVYEDIEVAGQGESSVVAVSATSSSPELAAAIANTYARAFVLEQQKSNQQFFDSALKLVEKQLDRLPASERFEEAGVALQNREQQLRLLKELKYGGVKLAQPAVVPSEPSSPNTKRNTLLGGILGLLLGIGLALVLERFERERRLREPEDLEGVYDLPLLGVVPQSPSLAGAARSEDLRPEEIETFNLIQARLRFFNVGQDLRTILITSAARDEGKSTISRFLAEAAARMGSRVLLVEADLRNPTLAAKVGVSDGPGLGEVVLGEARLEEAVRSLELGGAGQLNNAKTLDVLAASSRGSSNPGELMSSFMMNATLEKAKSEYDLVVVDTPPLTTVADGFPLLDKVDGVVVVSRLGRARRDLSERLRRTLDRSGAPQLGLIANGGRAGTAEAAGGYGRGTQAAPHAASNGSAAAADTTSEIKA
jgi:polysaccharide biosynthesis transport protein